MAAFDYSTVAELFPTKSEMESFPVKSRRGQATTRWIGRFARAADAIRLVIEDSRLIFFRLSGSG